MRRWPAFRDSASALRRCAAGARAPVTRPAGRRRVRLDANGSRPLPAGDDAESEPERVAVRGEAAGPLPPS
ncbi:hypothetical protein GCM10010345_81610 [Streptomyces canarius]|uniref:Uncharacterized protein n=1 Tax=Streptomyces canarius TaxID=285453 RepID=A0ABQ3D9S4_9ACTN|nr:hypothetical protein GCM10010345_81610 [Streptomyces canarius]